MKCISHLVRGCRTATQIRNVSTVDNEEIKRFGELAAHWGNEEGPFKALHSLNKLRVPWILKNHTRRDSKLLDVGCGGGLLSVPLARCGFDVTGIDAAKEGVEAAKNYLELPALKHSGVSSRVQYHATTAEDFVTSHSGAFDAVVASEILEHVANFDSFVTACAKLTKTGGSLFFTTINRTFVSKATAIWLAEDVLRIVPQGVHDWEKFVAPNELAECLKRNGCRVKAISGFTYHPLENRWAWISNNLVNYALVAEKVE